MGKINICSILKVKIVTIDVLEINGGIQIDLKSFKTRECTQHRYLKSFKK